MSTVRVVFNVYQFPRGLLGTECQHRFSDHSVGGISLTDWLTALFFLVENNKKIFKVSLGQIKLSVLINLK